MSKMLLYNPETEQILPGNGDEWSNRYKYCSYCGSDLVRGEVDVEVKGYSRETGKKRPGRLLISCKLYANRHDYWNIIPLRNLSPV